MSIKFNPSLYGMRRFLISLCQAAKHFNKPYENAFENETFKLDECFLQSSGKQATKYLLRFL